MSSEQSTVDYICRKISGAGEISYKKMFGEYAIYCDGKLPALVCDDQLFIKPTEEGRAYLGEVEEVPPYQGSKNYFLIGEDDWEEGARLTELIRITTAALPVPKPKKSSKPKV